MVYEDDIPGLPMRRWGCGSVVAISILTSAATSVGVVVALQKFGLPFMPGTHEAGLVRPVRVPDLARMPPEAARRFVSLVGLELQVAEARRPDPATPEGFVVEQDPEAGIEVAAGSVVRVVLAGSGPPLRVPNVLGQTVEQARTAFAKVGLLIGTGGGDGARVISGSQPQPGSEVARGATIRLLLAAPQPAGAQPAGNAPGTAPATPTAAGATTAPGTTGPAVPTPGVPLPVVATPGAASADNSGRPAPTTPADGEVEVPRLIGKRYPGVRKDLKAAGLKVGRIKETYDPDRGRRVVLRQSPSPGTRVTAGRRVSLVINQDD